MKHSTNVAHYISNISENIMGKVCVIFEKWANKEKCDFCKVGTIYEKMIGVSKGEHPFGSGFPIGARSIPVGTRFSRGKSSVLYLWRPLTLERGCHRTGQTVSRGSRTGGFCGYTGNKSEGFAMSKIRLFGCSWHWGFSAKRKVSCANGGANGI